MVLSESTKFGTLRERIEAAMKRGRTFQWERKMGALAHNRYKVLWVIMFLVDKGVAYKPRVDVGRFQQATQGCWNFPEGIIGNIRRFGT